MGTPLHGTAHFTFPHSEPADHRWRADAGGGALLDVGIYCLAPLLDAAAWRPGDRLPSVAGRAVLTDAGVDATFTGWLAFPSGFTAAFCCSFDAPETQTLEVVGTDGALRVDPAFTPGVDDRTIVVTGRDGTRTVMCTAPGMMYRLMIDHVGRVIRGIEPARRPVASSIALLTVLDHLRAAAHRTRR